MPGNANCQERDGTDTVEKVPSASNRGKGLSRRVLMLSLALAFLPPLITADDDAGENQQEIIERFVEMSRVQQQKLRGVTMDVEIAANLPKLKKTGKLHALRNISKLGRITYDALKFEGDNTVKKEVIARYLSTEQEATEKTAAPITPEFYKFRYRGIVERDNQQVHLFQVTPKKKQIGSFKGELWLDQATCLPIREAGRMVKNPSVFVKQFDFIRTYEIHDGISIPKQTKGIVETRLWGKAEMTVDYSNFSRQPDSVNIRAEGQLALRP